MRRWIDGNRLNIGTLGGLLVAFLVLVVLQGCSPMLPKQAWHVSDADVARIRHELGPDVSVEAIRDPKIDDQFEVVVPCGEMLAICYPGLSLGWKLLGGIPLACTRFWFFAFREPPYNYITEYRKTAIAYSCWATPEFANEHEREHLKGSLHK